MTEMFIIEEESGTYTGSPRRHNGYYAGDFSRNPMPTAGEILALANLRPPAFAGTSGDRD
jgi:hypothetical protein